MKHPKSKTVKLLKDADILLSQLSALNKKQSIIEKEKQKATSKFDKDIEKIEALKESIRGSIREFAEREKSSLFSNGKTVPLKYGKFGYRNNPPRIEYNLVTAIPKLKELFPDRNAIRTSETVDVKALSSFTDEELAKIDAKRIQKESFFCEALK